MNKLLSCRFNMDTNRVEARFEDGTTLAIDCIAVEDEYGTTPAQRAELDWLHSRWNRLILPPQRETERPRWGTPYFSCDIWIFQGAFAGRTLFLF